MNEQEQRDARRRLAEQFAAEVATWPAEKLRRCYAQPEAVAKAEERERGNCDDLDPAEFLRDAGWSVHAKQFKRDGQWVVDADAWPPRWLATNAVSSGPCSSFNEALQSVMRVIKQKFGSDAARKILETL